MVRLLIFIAIVAAVAVGAVWLADRPGHVALAWQGYEFRTSLLIGLSALLVVSVGLAIAWVAGRALIALPARLRHRRAEHRRERGLTALSRGMIAIGIGDAGEARRRAGEARRLLGDQPLARLLAAQEAQIAGDSARAESLFRAMADSEETRVLGLRGLFIEARRRHDAIAARGLAEAALAVRKDLAWASSALLESQAAERDWAGALATLSNYADSGGLDRTRTRRLRAVLLTAEAMDLEIGEPERARTLALEAHQLEPGLVAAATAAARLLERANDHKRAARLLEKAWKTDPHPEIAAAYAELWPGDAAASRLERIEHLVGSDPETREGALALARAAIDAGAWATARGALADLPSSQRACLLMAEIEDRQHGDHGRVREWLARALTAPRDPTWMADGRVYGTWEAIAPTNGRLDAFVWEVPPRQPEDDVAAALILSGRTRIAEAVPAPDEPIDLSPEADQPAAEPTRPPDDPGPEPEPEPEPPQPVRRRFGLL